MSRVLGRIRPLHFRLMAAYRRDSEPPAARWRRSSLSTLGWKSDRSVVADVAGRRPPRGNGQHDDAEREHRKSHEFEYQRVHGKSPNETDRFVAKQLTVS